MRNNRNTYSHHLKNVRIKSTDMEKLLTECDLFSTAYIVIEINLLIYSTDTNYLHSYTSLGFYLRVLLS